MLFKLVILQENQLVHLGPEDCGLEGFDQILLHFETVTFAQPFPFTHSLNRNHCATTIHAIDSVHSKIKIREIHIRLLTTTSIKHQQVKYIHIYSISHLETWTKFFTVIAHSSHIFISHFYVHHIKTSINQAHTIYK